MKIKEQKAQIFLFKEEILIILYINPKEVFNKYKFFLFNLKYSMCILQFVF